MWGAIVEGLGALVQLAIKTAGEAAMAKEAQHAAILKRVEESKAALEGERAGAHEEVDAIIAELRAENARLRKEGDATPVEVAAPVIILEPPDAETVIADAWEMLPLEAKRRVLAKAMAAMGEAPVVPEALER